MARLWTERYSPHLVGACNALLTAVPLPPLEIDGRPWRAARFELRPPRRWSGALDAGLSLALRRGRLTVDDASAWGPLQGVAWTTIAPRLQQLVVEQALQPLLRWLGEVLGEPVAAGDVIAPTADEPDAMGALGIGFEPLQADAAAARRLAYLWLADDDWMRVTATLAQSSGERRGVAAAATLRTAPRSSGSLPGGTRLPLSLRIVLGDVRLTRSELERVKPGDLLRLTGDSAPAGRPRRAILRLHRTDLFECRIERGGLLTIDNGNNSNNSNRAMPPDAGRPSMTSNDAAAAVKRLDQLEVPVSFQLGTLAVSLEQLAGIGPGHTFTTNLTTEQPIVAILVDGQKVGSGRLLAVGEMVGVQVVDWV